MTLEDTIKQCEALPLSDRIRLVHAVWDTIAAEGMQPALTDEQRRVFGKRVAELDANPDNVVTWEQIKVRIKGPS